MGILNDISKKAQEYAGIAVDKAKDLDESEVTFKVCPVCGAASDSKFCPHCGAPMGE